MGCLSVSLFIAKEYKQGNVTGPGLAMQSRFPCFSPFSYLCFCRPMCILANEELSPATTDDRGG